MDCTVTGGWRVDRPADGPAQRLLVSAIQTFYLSQVVTHLSLGNTLTSMARLHFAALLVAAALVVASGASFLECELMGPRPVFARREPGKSLMATIRCQNTLFERSSFGDETQQELASRLHCSQCPAAGAVAPLAMAEFAQQIVHL